MQNVSGCRQGVSLIECVNPRKGKWKIRWNVKDNGDGSSTWMEEDFNHKPTEVEVRDVILGWYNENIDSEIREGFK